MNAKQAREWIKDAPANPNPKNELAGFGFQCGGDDPESRETAGGPWFLCAECAGRLQARGCGFSSKEAGPIWEGQIHEDCAVCGHSAPTPAIHQPRPAAKHTPGPWHADIEEYPYRREIIITTENYDPDTCEGERIGRVFDDTNIGIANARLIAAAPAMKETLEYLAGKIAHIRRALVATGKAEFCNAWGILEAEDAARAAIAQAEGGAQ